MHPSEVVRRSARYLGRHGVENPREQAEAIAGALREFFPEEKRPASTWIGVSALAVPDFLIEIEATGVLE